MAATPLVIVRLDLVRPWRSPTADLIAEGRVLLAITPDGPPSTWTSWGLGADMA